MWKAVIFNKNPEETALMKGLLERLKVDVVDWSTKGSSWQESVAKWKPDLVIVDQVLAGRDGLTCIKQMSADSRFKILFTHPFSGTLANEMELNALASGAEAALQKPILMKQFQSAVVRIFRT